MDGSDDDCCVENCLLAAKLLNASDGEAGSVIVPEPVVDERANLGEDGAEEDNKMASIVRSVSCFSSDSIATTRTGEVQRDDDGIHEDRASKREQ